MNKTTSIKKGHKMSRKKTYSNVVVSGSSRKTSRGSKSSSGLLHTLPKAPKAVYVAVFLIIFGAIGTKMLFFSQATAFQYVGTHPQASQQPENSSGRPLTSLAAWNGKVYAGYGDWNKNTGPVYVTPFDPATNTFSSTSEHIADTESIEIWKEIGGKLYGLHVDPKSHNGAAYSLADATTGTAVWSNQKLPTMTHIFGITEGSSPSELFIAGQLDEGSPDNEVAKVYRSADGGATWSQSLSVPSRGGFNRMMFVAKLGSSIYAQNLSTANFSGGSPSTQAWVFNGSSWSKATPITGTYNPYKGSEFAGKIVAQTSPYGGSLVAYDGRSTTTVRSSIRDYKVHSDGYLYVLAYNNSGLSVMRTKDLTAWEEVSVVPNTSSSLALLGNTVYVGTSESQLYKAEINPLITDTTPPATSLIVPTSSYTVTQSNEFAVNASDTSSISKVEFYAGATLIGVSSYQAKAVSSGCFTIGTSSSCYTETSNYPGSYTIKWNGSGLNAGTYALKAIAYDLYGNSRETSSIAITVPEGLYPPDTTQPTVTINRPYVGQKNIRKSIVISATASDNDRIAYMEIQLDGKTVATSVSGSISTSAPIGKGSHSIIVIAKDQAGNTAQTERTFTSK